MAKVWSATLMALFLTACCCANGEEQLPSELLDEAKLLCLENIDTQGICKQAKKEPDVIPYPNFDKRTAREHCDEANARVVTKCNDQAELRKNYNTAHYWRLLRLRIRERKAGRPVPPAKYGDGDDCNTYLKECGNSTGAELDTCTERVRLKCDCPESKFL